MRDALAMGLEVEGVVEFQDDSIGWRGVVASVALCHPVDN